MADLIASLAKAERDGSLRERIRYLCRASLLVVDEIGYLPVVPGGGNLSFQLVNARYEKGAMILTSNRGFAELGEVFGDPVVATALLDWFGDQTFGSYDDIVDRCLGPELPHRAALEDHVHRPEQLDLSFRIIIDWYQLLVGHGQTVAGMRLRPPSLE